MRRGLVLFALVLAFIFCISGAALAETSADFDFLRFAKEEVLTDFHPTAKPSQAIADYDEKPFVREEGITRARVIMYYSGWVRKHNMLVEMDLNSTERTILVRVLQDSNGMNLLGSSTFKEGQWVSLSSLGW